MAWPAGPLDFSTRMYKKKKELKKKYFFSELETHKTFLKRKEENNRTVLLAA